jgi:two-component system, OmpR family, osmolarity sensor histidine kinase EnvZ
MRAPPVKPYLPRRLFGRALLILMVPIVVLQLVVGYVFFERHYQRVTHQMTSGVAAELTYALDRVREGGGATGLAAISGEFSAALGIELEFQPGAIITPGLARETFDLSGLELAEALRDDLDVPLAIDLESDTDIAIIRAAVAGGVLEARVPRSRLSVANPHQLLVLMVLVALLLSAAAVMFLRNQVRPIRALAEASEAFGKGRSLPFRPAGAEEVRRAGAAFLSMRSRLERQIEQRTQMLSGVSHDLRTPLTRMKLTLALLDDADPEVRALRDDVTEMERMISEFLAFARGDGLEEAHPADPFELAREVAEQARRSGAEITVAEVNEAPGSPLVTMRRGAVARALQNLVANAVRYGSRQALQVRLLRKTVDFVVEDDGPGIPEADRSRAVMPFARLDAARSREAGVGVGLGLAIALDVARSHGGSLELGESPELGGLRAVLRLPR